MIVIINGAPGSGKSKTTERLFLTTDNSTGIDGDYLLAINPSKNGEEERQLRYKNIATLARNYHEAGYKNIFISFVYAGKTGLSEQIELLKAIDSIHVFSLVPQEETLRKRHQADTYKREEIASVIEINNKIAQMNDSELIDNTNLSIDEVVNRIKQKLNL